MIKNIAFFLTLIFSISVHAYTDKQISETLTAEFDQLYSKVKNLKHTYEIGGILKGKKIDNFELLWNLDSSESGYDTIRVYKDYGVSKQAFAVTYYRAKHIVPGAHVIRRFIGKTQSGWRADTVDYDSGFYYFIFMQKIRTHHCIKMIKVRFN